MSRQGTEPLLREGIDIPFGPPPEEYLYRCPVCDEEMLVNDVTKSKGWPFCNAKFGRKMHGLANSMA